MSRAKLPLLPLLALLFILGACQSEGKIEGEVFIVTEGRENIEMGLVEVSAIPKSALRSHLDDRFASAQRQVRAVAGESESILDSLTEVQDRRSALRKKVSSEQSNLQGLQNKYGQFRQEFEPIKSLIEKASASVVEDISVGDEVATYSDASIRNEPNLSSDAIVDKVSKSSIGKVVNVKRSAGLYEVEFSNVKGWIQPIEIVHLEEYNKWRERNNSELNKEIKSKIRNQNRVVEKIKEQTEKKYEKTKRLESMAISEMRKIEEYRENNYFFNTLPNDQTSDETGSDGRYDLTVSSGSPYYITAQAERSVGDEVEEYYWMVKTTVSGGETKELNLSNDNLGGAAEMKYALSERTLSTVEVIWQSAISLAKEGEEMDWEKLIYRTAFPEDTTDVPIPDDLNVPEEKLLSNR